MSHYSLLTITTLTLANNYKQVFSNNGIIAFKLKSVRIRVGYERIIHEIDLESIERNLETLQDISETYNNTSHLKDTLNQKIKIANGKLKSLQFRRTKRALVNILGSAIKYVAGNPDSQDLETIEKSLSILENKSNQIIENQNEQIKINTILQKRTNNILVNLKKLDSLLTNQTNKNLADLDTVNLIFNCDNIIKIVEDIEEQIAFARLNLVNKNILSVEEKNYIFNQLKKQGLEINFVDEILKHTSSSISFGSKGIILLVKIPKLEEEPYDLVRLETINNNGTIIDTQFQLVAKNYDKVYAQSANCDICENSTPINDECIFNMLTHAPPKCHTTRSRNATTIKEIKKGIVLIDTNVNILITDSCGEKRTINGPTIAEITNCTMTVENQTFSNTPQRIFKTEYLTPLYAKTFQKLEPLEKNEDFEELKRENLRHISKIHTYVRETQGSLLAGVIILIPIVILGQLCFNHFIYKKNRQQIIFPQINVMRRHAQTVTNSPTAIPEESGKTNQEGMATRQAHLPRFALYSSQSRTTDKS